MRSIKIVIERAEDHYAAYAPDVWGVTGVGDTPNAAKAAVLDAIDVVKENKPNDIPDALKGDFELEFQYDVESLLNYYKGIFTNAAIEKVTGINQKLIQHYASGLKKPRTAQRKKIEEGLHKLGKELLAIEL
ncbi:type II toxin-antitoxin system HicB family antitoxin [Litoribacter ruber]|uniref:type II toxin-antitoxin system HicB family antitoxin n=1 Tax=Litoribacter ruber TaxID=702568 RepID=UPI001BDAA00D|nr:type II toxin-antitoxin system HicB family antitoxin [Litoribacter ruber]MBT0811560.1 type II toxin-antitoxin system HicB family antitoxin [Litoribacter ruber]